MQPCRGLPSWPGRVVSLGDQFLILLPSGKLLALWAIDQSGASASEDPRVRCRIVLSYANISGGVLESLFDTAEGGEDREGRLAELARQVSVCTKCDLAKTRTNTVFASGDPYSPLMLVGEGPGENEDATGLPFVGRAGKLLDDILAAVDLTRQQIYLTNIVKCRAA